MKRGRWIDYEAIPVTKFYPALTPIPGEYVVVGDEKKRSRVLKFDLKRHRIKVTRP